MIKIAAREKGLSLLKPLKRMLKTTAATLRKAIAWIAFAIIAVPAAIVVAMLVAIFDREEVQDARRNP